MSKFDELKDQSISQGTLNPAHLIPCFLNLIETGKHIHSSDVIDDEYHINAMAIYNQLDGMMANYDDQPIERMIISDQMHHTSMDDHHPFFESNDALYFLNEMIWEFLDFYGPAGYYFGSHPGNGSDIGYWPIDDDDDVLYININQTEAN